MLLVVGLVHVLEPEQLCFHVNVQNSLLFIFWRLDFDSRGDGLFKVFVEAHRDHVWTSGNVSHCSFLQDRRDYFGSFCVSWHNIVIRPKQFIGVI